MPCTRYASRDAHLALRVKHGLDWLALLVITPFALLLALLIVPMSHRRYGRVLTSRWCIGKHGRRFKHLRFYLPVDDDEALRLTFCHTHHLGQFTRPAGIDCWTRFLLCSGLYRLPEWWNLARGELTLVGAAPILEQELPEYPYARQYADFRPGLFHPYRITCEEDWLPAVRGQRERRYFNHPSLAADLTTLRHALRFRCGMPVLR